MTGAAILALLQVMAGVLDKAIESQPVEVRAEMWKRYIEATAPLHAGLMKVEGLVLAVGQKIEDSINGANSAPNLATVQTTVKK